VTSAEISTENDDHVAQPAEPRIASILPASARQCHVGSAVTRSPKLDTGKPARPACVAIKKGLRRSNERSGSGRYCIRIHGSLLIQQSSVRTAGRWLIVELHYRSETVGRLHTWSLLLDLYEVGLGGHRESSRMFTDLDKVSCSRSSDTQPRATSASGRERSAVSVQGRDARYRSGRHAGHAGCKGLVAAYRASRVHRWLYAVTLDVLIFRIDLKLLYVKSRGVRA